MIIIDQQKYESIISEIIYTKDIQALVSKYLKDKIYYYSILHDICDPESNNRSIVKNTALEYKLSQGYVREQSNTILSYLSPEPPEIDYYKILDVSPDASKEEIRKSWTRLMKDHHPDVIGERGLEMSRKINEAYSILKDENKKRIFDERRMPFLDVKVRKYRKIKITGTQKKILAVAGLFVLIILFFLSVYSKNERTELAEFRSNDFTAKPENSNTISTSKIDENKRLLDQIEKIKPAGSDYTKRVDNNEGKVIEENGMRGSPVVVPAGIDTEKETIPKEKPTHEDKVEKLQADIPSEEKSVKKTVKKIDDKVQKNDENKVEHEKGVSKKNYISAEKPSLKDSSGLDQNVKTKPTSSSLYKFVSDYVTAYKNMDIKKISSLFHDDAMENGLPISEALDLYASNFSKNEIIKYDLKINSTKIDETSGYVDSNFVIIFEKLSNREIKSTNGKITWNLVWDDENWKIKDINYNIFDTINMDEPFKRQ